MAYRTIDLDLDDSDYDAVQKAVSQRQVLGRNIPGCQGGVMPDTESNRAGAVLAEICRWFTQMIRVSAETTSPKKIKGDVAGMSMADRAELLRWLQEREAVLEDKS